MDMVGLAPGGIVVEGADHHQQEDRPEEQQDSWT